MPPQKEGTELPESLEPQEVLLVGLAKSWLSSQTGHSWGTKPCHAKQKVMKNDINEVKFSKAYKVFKLCLLHAKSGFIITFSYNSFLVYTRNLTWLI